MLDVNMVERTRRSGQADSVVAQAPAIQAGDLSAEFSTGQRPSGEWFALGTVRAAGVRFDGFPWVVVGTGPSRQDAITQLTEMLSQAAQASASDSTL